jgi:hypothetical protein
MNFIAATLLKVLKDEEKSFWLFAQIMENLLPIDYYSGLIGILID